MNADGRRGGAPDGHFDALETRAPETRERALFERFGERLAELVERLPGLARHLDGRDPRAVDSRAALAALPVLRKDALMAAQAAAPPFGGFVDAERLRGARLFMSPGPVFEPQRPGPDPWGAARALYAAGFRAGTRVHNAFSYHLTPGGFILDEGARALGCTVFPGGVGASAMQRTAIRHYRAEGYTGTPDFLATLLEGGNDGPAPDSLRLALVSGGALPESLRERYREAGIRCLQCYATADAGVIAYESATGDTVHPGMLVNEDLLVEIVRPGSDEPLPAGETGEVVVTRLDPVMPLVRFGTGDLSAFLDGASPCGRTARRLAGWRGRADQRTKVRGMFVDPAQVEAIRREHADAVERLRLVVGRDGERDTLRLLVERRAGVGPDGETAELEKRLGETLRRLTGLGGAIEPVASLPADGVVVEDARPREEG